MLHVVRLRREGVEPFAALTDTEAFVPWVIAQEAGELTRAALARKAFVQVLDESGIRVGAADRESTRTLGPDLRPQVFWRRVLARQPISPRPNRTMPIDAGSGTAVGGAPFTSSANAVPLEIVKVAPALLLNA